jgi:hypothetical protein
MSANLDFEWTNGHPEELAAKLDRFGEELIPRLEQAVDELVLRVQATAQRLVRVDTGRLRASIEGVVERLAGDIVEGVVGTNVEYARYVESDYPFLRPAIEAEWPRIRSRTIEAVRSAWEAV